MGFVKSSYLNNLHSVLINIVTLIVSVILLMLSQPNIIFENGLGLIAFVALVPMFFVIYNLRIAPSFIYGFLYGLLYYILINYWLLNFNPLAIVVVPLLKGVEFGLIFVVLTFSLSLFKKYSSVVLALVYTSMLYLFETTFQGYSYGNIAYSLYRHLILIQCVDLIGIWLLVFFLSFLQARIAEYLNSDFVDLYSSFDKNERIFVRVKRGFVHFFNSNKVVSIALSSIFAFIILYGAISLGIKNNRQSKDSVEVVAIQHNMDNRVSGVDHYKESLEVLTSMTYEGLRMYPDAELIVWSETAVIPSIRWHREHQIDRATLSLIDDLLSFSLNFPTPILTGNGDAVLKEDAIHASLTNAYYYNASVLLDKGEVKNVYRKQHLVPFAETFPYKDTFPSFYAFLEDAGMKFFDSGDECVLFEIKPGFNVFTSICFEDAFGYISREGVKKGADAIINITDDSWSLSRVSQMQHLSLGVFRSIENNVPTLRVANSGATCLVEPTGRIRGLLNHYEKEIGGYELSIYSSPPTLYTLIGDMGIKLISILTGLILIVGVLLHFKREKGIV